MSPSLRFGVLLPTDPAPRPEGLIRAATHAQQAGFDDVWIDDRPADFEPLGAAGLIGGRLRRIGVGVSGLALPLRDPVLLAKQIASVHELSGRRLTVAFADGDANDALTDEHLEALVRIFRDDHPLSLDLPHVKFTGAVLYPKPRDLGIWISGESEVAWRRVASWGSGWLVSDPASDDYGRRVARMSEVAAAAGRDPESIVTAASIRACVESDDDRARVREHIAALYAGGLRYALLELVARDLGAYDDVLRRTAEEVLPPLRRLT